ncbi:MAG: hypothetical protein PHG67_06045 [Bacteroidales bacterium]|jgi:hypothetical protein|nr:hypothetical protein [Bacteroidales bacterium]
MDWQLISFLTVYGLVFIACIYLLYKVLDDCYYFKPTPKKMDRYYRQTNVKTECHACLGKGYKDYNEYHNRPVRCCCYICNGTGSISTKEYIDVTDQLLEFSKKTNTPLP